LGFKTDNSLIFAFIFGWLSGLIFAGLLGFVWPMTLLLAISLMLMIGFSIPTDNRLHYWLAIFLLAFSLGQWRLVVVNRRAYDFELDQQIGEAISLTGQVTSHPLSIGNDYFVFDLKPIDFNGRVSVMALWPSPQVGQVISIDGKLRPNLYQSAVAKYRLSSYSSPIVVNDQVGWLAKLYYLRDHLTLVLSKILPEPQASLAQAMMFGGQPPADWQRVFRRFGLAHIFVLSGYHLSVIVGGLALGLSFLNRRLALILSLLLAFPFILMVGAGFSISRAFIMAVITATAILFGQSYRPARALLIAAMILSFFNPTGLLSSRSFQLSFMATLGIIWLAKPIANRLDIIRPILVRNLLAVTLAAQLFVLPIIALYFDWPSVLSPLANLFILPLMPAVIFFGWLAVFLFYLYPILGYVAGWVVWGLTTLQLKLVAGFWLLDNSLTINKAVLIFVIGVFICYFLLSAKLFAN
jgi:ComEC/Rec2-related protein